MRTVSSQLAIFEAEVGRLTENQVCAEKEWKDKTSHLECQLTQVTTQKVDENGICVFRSFIAVSVGLVATLRCLDCT